MQKPGPFRVIIFIVSLIVISGGILLYSSLAKRIKYEKQNELAAIVSLKVEDIAKWRREHFRDAVVFRNDIPLNKLISAFLKNDKQEDLKQELLTWMQSFMKNYDYQSILVLDNTKTVRLSFPPADSLRNSIITAALDTLDHNKINFSDLHVSDNAPGIMIDLLVPLISQDSSAKNDSKNFGTVVLRINPEITLFPLIQSWPTPSKSSETLLLRLDGDSVIYLNELRHQKNTALQLKFPLSNRSLPAAVAALGYEGVFEGYDYRNVGVISFLKKIPDSPWFMVAKIDKEELNSSLNELILFISIIACLVIFSISVMIGYYLRNQRIREQKKDEIALKENEVRLRELNATKDKFFSIVSHDLRTPFTSIMGFSELLIEKIRNKDFDRADEFASIINTSSQRAMDLLTNLREWSRLQTGRMDYCLSEVDIISVINEVTGLLNASALHKSITIIRNSPLNLKIMADKAMISTVLRNLIANSIKFSYPGNKVIVSADRYDNEVRIGVKDFGTGMKKDTVARLFRIESSFSTPGTQDEEGSGLGLILCKEFVSKHGGEIWVESEVGKGSKFTFTLPL